MATMFEIVAKAIVYGLEVYAGLGLVFALVFVWAGVQNLDSEAQGAGVGFRLLILPGVAALPVDKARHRTTRRRKPAPPIDPTMIQPLRTPSLCVRCARVHPARGDSGRARSAASATGVRASEQGDLT